MAKGKFDFKELMLNHGEKIGLGVVALLLIYMTITAFGRDPRQPNEQPVDITNAVNVANDVIVQGMENVDADINARVSPPVDYASYRVADPPQVTFAPPINPAPLLFPEQRKREDPEILPAQELIASAGLGPVAFAGGAPPAAAEPMRQLPAGVVFGGARPGGNAVSRGQSWVVLRAILPVDQQQTIYDDLFRDAEHKTAADVVRYTYPVVERAEVAPGSSPDPAQLTWESLQAKNRSEFFLGFLGRNFASVPPVWAAAKLPDPVAEKWHYSVEAPKVQLTSALPPLLLRDWTVEELGHPRIAAAATAAVAPEPEAPLPMPEILLPGEAPKAAAPQAAAVKGADAITTFRLLRFFDYTAQPGKTYLYRVRLVAANPNHGVLARYLRQPVDQPETISSPSWAMLARPITVPEGNRILAMAPNPADDDEVKKDDRRSAMARVMVVQWDPNTGQQRVKVLSRQVGQPLAYPHPMDIGRDDDKAIFLDKDGNEARNPRTGRPATRMPRGGRLKGDVEVLDPIQHKYRVGEQFSVPFVVADVLGADTPNPTVLLWDQNSGELISCNAAEDEQAVQEVLDFYKGTAQPATPPPADQQNPDQPPTDPRQPGGFDT